MISFCVSWNIESHTGLEQHEGEQIMTYFLFLGELFNSVNVTLSIVAQIKKMPH